MPCLLLHVEERKKEDPGDEQRTSLFLFRCILNLTPNFYSLFRNLNIDTISTFDRMLPHIIMAVRILGFGGQEVFVLILPQAFPRMLLQHGSSYYQCLRTLVLDQKKKAATRDAVRRYCSKRQRAAGASTSRPRHYLDSVERQSTRAVENVLLHDPSRRACCRLRRPGD